MAKQKRTPARAATSVPSSPASDEWTDKQREAARAFISKVRPNNTSTLVSNIELIMPTAWREGFEALFAKLEGAKPR